MRTVDLNEISEFEKEFRRLRFNQPKAMKIGRSWGNISSYYSTERANRI